MSKKKIVALSAAILIVVIGFSLGSELLKQGRLRKEPIYIDGYVALKASFHTHTTFSDGSCSPTELVAKYFEAGYDCVAITDHNTLAGVSEAKSAATQYGIIVVSGEEISIASTNNSQLHVVALWINEQIAIETENVELVFDLIHQQDGVGVVAHPDTWGSNQWSGNFTDSPWFPYRNASFIDGWERASYNWEVYDLLLNSGYFMVEYDDFHQGQVLRDVYTLVFAKNMTDNGIREALLSQRDVMVWRDLVFGVDTARELYQKYISKTAGNV